MQSTDLARDAIHSMTGCYVVDYSYHESEAKKPDYKLDTRTYDVNSNKTVMEWIFAEDESPTHVRLQHVLFSIDAKGNVVKDGMIRHQAEDWERDPAWAWEYLGRSRWKRNDVPHNGQWVRRITNLDDGLRYQCVAGWTLANGRAEWSCADNFAPIPGRETRDMKRADYQALVRKTHLLVFPQSWVEKQNNEKTLVTDDGTRTALASENGRTWYVRADDAMCKDARVFSKEHLAFWQLLEQTWNAYFTASTEWRDTPPGHGTPRWSKIDDVEDKHFHGGKVTPSERDAAQKEIRAIIDADRAGNTAP